MPYLRRKDPSFDGKKLLDLDKQTRDLKQLVDDLRCEKNELAKKGQSGVSDELRERSKLVSTELKERERELQEKNDAFKTLYLHCPNIIMESVPDGGKEQNLVVKVWGKKT